MTGLDLDKIAAAKLWLIGAPVGNAAGPEVPRDLPYLATGLYSLIAVPDERVPRMTCDEWWRIYINPAWLTAATVPEVGAELAHLLWHLLAEHAGRARDMDVDRSNARTWDECADFTISDTLQPDLLRPPELPTASQRGFPHGHSAEEYFAFFAKADTQAGPDTRPLGPGEGCGSGADGIRREHEQPPDSDIGSVSTVEAGAIRERVAIDYREFSRQRGTDPGGLLRWVERILTPHVPWEPLLSGAVRRGIGWAAGRGDYTYTRPSRRAGSLRGVILPGQHRAVPRVSMVIDTSGSVDDEMLARAVAEVDAAIAALGLPGSHVTVHAVDAEVHTTRAVRSARRVELVGAGGTDLRIGLRAVEQERPRPDVVVVLTDGFTPWPATPPPGAAVIIALLRRRQWPLPETPSWATVVECVVD